MSLHEKVNRYLTEQEKIQRIEEQIKRETLRAKEEKLRFAQEKIPPLVEALKSLPVVQLLTEIKNDEWGCGNIEVYPREITAKTPINSWAELSFIFYSYFIAGETEEYMNGTRTYPDSWVEAGEHIKIGTKWDKDKENCIILYGEVEDNSHTYYGERSYPPFPELYADDPRAASVIEEWLMKIIIERRGRKDPPPFERYVKPPEKTGFFRKLFNR